MKSVAIDGTNCLYQFLRKSRLTKRVASLQGFLYRAIAILECKYIPIFIFDGHRQSIKHRSRPRKDYTTEVMKLLRYMGIPTMRSIYDAEAQCAALSPYIEFVSTMDLDDAFAFGASKCGGDDLRPAKQMISQFSGQRSKIAILSFSDWLNFCHLPADWDRETYIDFRLLLGTDFNPKVLHWREGKAKAIKLLHSQRIEETEYWTEKLSEAKNFFMYPKVKSINPRDLKLISPNFDQLYNFLPFNRSRMKNAIDRLDRASTFLLEVKTIDRWL